MNHTIVAEVEMNFPFVPTKNSEESDLAAPQAKIRLSTEQRNAESNESEAAPFAAALHQDPPIKRIAKKRDAINTEAFVDSVISDLGDHVMGYCMLLQGRKGNVIGQVNYGYARSRFEDGGAQPFNKVTQTAWGSVTKMITTAAVIDKTERSTTRSLEEKMVDFLPRKWRDDVHEDYLPVTIRHLLSHQSGLGPAPDGVEPRDIAKRLTYPAARRIGIRSYENINFSLFLYMGRFFRSGHWDELEDKYRPGEISYDSYVHAHGASNYKKVLQDRIFEPLNIKGSCNDSRYAGNNYSLYYTNPTQEKGYLLNPNDHFGCSTGGIVMSPQDMGKFLHALSQTDQIMSRANYQSLLAVPNNDVLGWNGSLKTDDGGYAFHKAGGRTLRGTSIPGNTATGNAGADIMVFPNGMTAVIAVNSKRPDTVKKLWFILRDAYNAGLSK